MSISIILLLGAAALVVSFLVLFKLAEFQHQYVRAQVVNALYGLQLLEELLENDQVVMVPSAHPELIPSTVDGAMKLVQLERNLVRKRLKLIRIFFLDLTPMSSMNYFITNIDVYEFGKKYMEMPLEYLTELLAERNEKISESHEEALGRHLAKAFKVLKEKLQGTK